jgi:hypothetical protein
MPQAVIVLKDQQFAEAAARVPQLQLLFQQLRNGSRPAYYCMNAVRDLK